MNKKNLSERMNFSLNQDNDTAIVIDSTNDISFIDILTDYCIDYEIDLRDINDDEFVGAVLTMGYYGEAQDKCTYYFWID